MALGNLFDTNIRLIYEAGLDQEGNMKYKSRNYNNIKVDATPDGIYQAAQAIASLSSLSLYAVERYDKTEITE